MDPQLQQFHRQYLQQVTNLTYPPSKLLAHSDIQQQLYRHFFNSDHDTYFPPPTLQRRVLKRILNDIEQTATDDGVSDDLMTHMGHLSSLPAHSDADTAQMPRVLSYHVPSPVRQDAISFDNTDHVDRTTERPRILIRESPRLLAAGSNVGFRTWEACLRLGYYLCTSGEREGFRGANVLELGAGTGLLSLICAMELGARRVVATDGLVDVVESIVGNVGLNEAEMGKGMKGVRLPVAAALDWSDPLDAERVREMFRVEEEDEGIGEGWRLDYVLGADVMYHPELHGPLAGVIAGLKRVYPQCRALFSTPVRNEETYRLWKQSCAEYGLQVREVDEADGWKCPPYRLQTGLFHEQVFPIVIVEIETRQDA